MSEVTYNVAKARLATGALDLDSDTIKVLLLKVAPAGCSNPDIDTVTALLAVSTAAECDFTNYVRKTLGSAAVTEDDTNNRADVDYANVTWGAAGGASNNTPAAMVVYEDVDGTDANSRLVSYHDTGFGVTATNGGDWTAVIAPLLRIL